MNNFVLYQTNIARVRNCPGITILVSNEVCNGVVDGVGVTKSHTYISFYNLCDSPKICWLLSSFPSTAFKLGFDQGGRDGWVGGVGSFINFSQCSFLKFLFFLSLTKSLVALDSLMAVWIVIQEKNCPSLPSSFSDEVSCALEGIFPQFLQFHLWFRSRRVWDCVHFSWVAQNLNHLSNFLISIASQCVRMIFAMCKNDKRLHFASAGCQFFLLLYQLLHTKHKNTKHKNTKTQIHKNTNPQIDKCIL